MTERRPVYSQVEVLVAASPTDAFPFSHVFPVLHIRHAVRSDPGDDVTGSVDVRRGLGVGEHSGHVEDQGNDESDQHAKEEHIAESNPRGVNEKVPKR